MAGPLAGVGFQQPQITQSTTGQPQNSAGQVRQEQQAQQTRAEGEVERVGDQVQQNFESNNSDLTNAETDFSFNAANLAGADAPRGSLVNVLV